MYPIEVIKSESYQSPAKIRDNFNRDSSLCKSRRGYVIHSGIHRSTAFIYAPADSYDNGEAWQALTYWKDQGQQAVNGFIEALIETHSLESAEKTAISRRHPTWVFQRVNSCGNEVFTAVQFRNGFETRISEVSFQLLNEKIS